MELTTSMLYGIDSQYCAWYSRPLWLHCMVLKTNLVHGTVEIDNQNCVWHWYRILCTRWKTSVVHGMDNQYASNVLNPNIICGIDNRCVVWYGHGLDNQYGLWHVPPRHYGFGVPKTTMVSGYRQPVWWRVVITSTEYGSSGTEERNRPGTDNRCGVYVV